MALNNPTVLSVLDLNPRKFGSMEEFACQLSATLSERNCRSVLVFSEAMPPHVATWFKNSGAIIESVNQRIGLGFYLRLRNMISTFKPEVVHFHFYEQFSVLPLWAALCGAKKVFFTDHCRQPLQSGRLTKLKLRIWNAFIPHLLGVKFITISEHMKRLLVSDYFMDGDRINVVLNGVSTDRFKPLPSIENARARKEYSVPEGSLLVSTAAALIPEKGIEYFLQAAKLILREEPRAYFLVAGDGGLESELKSKSAEIGIGDRIRFVGLISDISKYLAMADVVVVPSIWEEPAGLVVIESMACGRPVVATKVGGIPEYVADGSAGILVEPRRPDRIAEAVLAFLRTPELSAKMGLAARAQVECSFTIDHWVANVVELYGTEFRGVPEVRYAAPTGTAD